MKKRIAVILAIAMMAVIVTTAYAAVPSVSFYSIVENESVTVRTSDFPSGHTFHVYMGENGTMGIGGKLVSKITTGEGGAFLAKFFIPEELSDEDIIAVRFESVTDSKYHHYNWFFNETAIGSASSISSGTTYNNVGYGVPAFDVLSVSKGSTVTIRTRFFPSQQRYAVFMKDGALADITWYEVQGIETGEGNSQTITIAVPEALRYSEKWAIKLYNVNDGSYWYNLVDNINQ